MTTIMALVSLSITFLQFLKFLFQIFAKKSIASIYTRVIVLCYIYPEAYNCYEQESLTSRRQELSAAEPSRVLQQLFNGKVVKW